MKKLIILFCLCASVALATWGSFQGLLSGTTTAVDTDFKMTWAIASTNAVTIPTVNGANYNGTINWGDGSGDKSFSVWNDTNLTHSFSSTGDYQIAINVGSTGKFDRIYFNDGAYKLLLKSVDNWGDVQFTSLANGFFGCANATSYASPIPAMPSVTSLYYTWRINLSATSFPDVSALTNVTTLQATWLQCSSATSFPAVSALTNVTTLRFTWYECGGATSFPDVSALTKVTAVERAWTSGTSATSLPDISALTLIETLLLAYTGCSSATSGMLTVIPAGCTTASSVMDNCSVLVGDVSTITNSVVCTTFGADDSDSLTYGSTGGFLSTNVIANGYSFDMTGCSLAEGNVDNILADLDTSGATNGTCLVAGDNAAPSAAGLTSKSNLVAKAWTVTSN